MRRSAKVSRVQTLDSSRKKNADDRAGVEPFGILRHDEKTVCQRHGGDVAAALPRNERDRRQRAGKCARRRQKARKARFRLYVCGKAREGEARTAIETA